MDLFGRDGAILRVVEDRAEDVVGVGEYGRRRRCYDWELTRRRLDTALWVLGGLTGCSKTGAGWEGGVRIHWCVLACGSSVPDSCALLPSGMASSTYLRISDRLIAGLLYLQLLLQYPSLRPRPSLLSGTLSLFTVLDLTHASMVA